MAESTMQPWVANLLEELNEMSKKNIVELSYLMERIGIDDSMKSEWIEILKEQVLDTYSNLLDDAKIYQNKLIDSIEELLKQSEELCKQLRIKMPPYGSESLSLSQEKALLKCRITEYEARVKVTKDEMTQLRKRQVQACKSLGQEPLVIPDSPLPTTKELDDFAIHVEKLENEKFKRETKFLEVKCKILEIVQELGIKPSLEIEKTICSPDDSLFLVTDYNMKWIEEYYESLIDQKTQTAIEIANLREKLSGLWGILSEDIKTCSDFLQKHTGTSLNTLEALQLEVKRCEDLKKANIEKFIKKLRDELSSLWEKCHYTSSERSEFPYFYENLYTEDLVDFHDLEIQKVKTYYEENKDIFTLLEQLEQYWKKKFELEERTRDPNRYKNRRGALLTEEKERVLVTKKIRDVEFELLELARKYEEDHRKVFLSWGRSVADIIEQTHEEYENNKKQQLSAKKQQRNLTATPVKSGFLGSTLSGSRKNLLTLTPTPVKQGFLGSMLSGSRKNLLTLTPKASGSKRKLALTPLASSSKKKTPVTGSELDLMKGNEETNKKNVRRARLSHERKKRIDKIRRISWKLEKKKKTANDTVNYDSFEKEIAIKESCRSTLFNDPSGSTCTLAVPLPVTPRVTHLPTTPKVTPRRNVLHRTPTFTKLKAVPGSKMDI